MKKSFLGFLLIMVITITSIALLMPAYIFANGDTYDHSLAVGKAGENTNIRFWGTGYANYFKFIRLYDDKTGDQIDNLIAADKTNPWDIIMINSLAAGNYHYDLIISEDWDGWASEYGLLVYPLGNIQLNESHYFTVDSSNVLQVLPTWVRTLPMTCWQVWINENNNFQFIFWYPYRDNNWVKIYDMNGKLVFEKDLPYDNPNLIVDLPNDMYTVKTYHVDPTTPIQTFIIGK